MEKKKAKPRYFKVTIITFVVAAIILAGVLGSIHARDRIDLDIQRLKTSIQIAATMHVKLAFHEGAVVLKREGIAEEKTVALPTLKSASFKEKTIQVVFQSLFFSKTIDIEKTERLEIPPAADN